VNHQWNRTVESFVAISRFSLDITFNTLSARLPLSEFDPEKNKVSASIVPFQRRTVQGRN
jgi:hypothetical protein